MNQYPMGPENNENGLQHSGQPVYNAAWQPVEPFFQQPFLPPQKPKKKKKFHFKKSTAFLAAGVMLFSGILGAGGGYLAVKLNGAGGKTVLYQSAGATPTSTSTGGAGSVTEVVNKTAASVVEITTEALTTGSRMGQYVSKGAGSGVVLSKDGYIATNYHVISGAQKMTVRTKDGNSYTATLVGSDEQSDLAVLKIDASDLTPVVFADSSKLQVGETAIAIGNPLGELGGTVTTGIVSALDREITIDGQTMTLLQTNAAINPGNSGGGLFNASGELVGIVNAKSSGTDVEGLGFAIPSNTAKEVVTQLIENGHVSGRVDAGFTAIDLTDTATAMQYGVSQRGIYVNQVTSLNCPLRTGDRIVSIDGKEISSMSDYNSALSSGKAGDTLTVVAERSRQQVTEKVTLAEQSSTRQ